MGTSTKSIDGIPVTDAKSDLEIHVTPSDCKHGDPKRPETCAAARAIRREYGAIDVRVHLSRVYVRQNKGNWQRYIPTEPLQREIVALDRNGEFEPGVYRLRPPSPDMRFHRGKRAGGHSPKKGRKTGKLRPRIATKNVRTGPAYGDE